MTKRAFGKYEQRIEVVPHLFTFITSKNGFKRFTPKYEFVQIERKKQRKKNRGNAY
jgi:hypothetical protein